jgi:acylphosphatase
MITTKIMKKHYNLRIKGKVQGVWYRASTQKQAEMLGISGFVRNEADGSVYAEAEGDEAVLDQFVEWCWQGPSEAVVEEVVKEEGPLKDFRAFKILRR